MVDLADCGRMIALEKMARIGQWLFQNRTYLPLVLIPLLALLNISEVENSWVFYVGGVFILMGEMIRIWGVGYAGSITRTRKRRLKSLVTNGPFAYVRNPLYIGNLFLWTGFTLCSELVWLVPIIWVWFILQYMAIVRWEEKILEEEFGEAYIEYKAVVPRWLPRIIPFASRSEHDFQLMDAIISERGTFGTIIFLIIVIVIKEYLR